MNIETEFLSEFEKEFITETGELKFLLTVLKDMNSHMSFFSKKTQDQNKLMSLFGKNVISITNSITSDFNDFSESDISQLSKIELIFLDIASNIGKFFVYHLKENCFLLNSTIT